MKFDNIQFDIDDEDCAISTMSDQEALAIVLALAGWAVNRFRMSSEEYAKANLAIQIMEDIKLEG